MKANIGWIPGVSPGRLAILPRPRGGDWLDDEMIAWRNEGVDVVVSMLTDDEVAELILADESAATGAAGLEFVSLPVPDRGTPPDSESATNIVAKIADSLVAGKGVAIHCRAGVGRSALLAAAVLVSEGADPSVAFERIGQARGVPVPETAEQREWVERFAESIAATH